MAIVRKETERDIPLVRRIDEGARDVPSRVWKDMKTKTLVAVIAALVIVDVALASTPSDPNNEKIIADRILVEKSARRLTLLHNGLPMKRYKISLGKNPIGNKEKEGDNRTPEGIYKIDWRNGQSLYHRALHISYPTPDEVERARRRGVSAGGNILIHGLPNGRGWIGSLHTLSDWTLGCIAVTDEEIDEIWDTVPDGILVEIRP